MKRFLSICFALFLFAQVSWAEELHEYSALIEDSRDAVVLVATESESGQGGFGSGFLITDDGIVVTNYHVIHRNTNILIWFYDEDDPRHYPATVLAIDPVSDIALLQIEVKPRLLPLEFLDIEGDKEEIRVGDAIISIGHFLGLDWTVTRGYISHINRPNRISPYISLIQHDAAINRGNSGGPVINTEGNVVGVNTYAFLSKNEHMGAAYALRGDILDEIVEELIESGEVVRPGLGLKLLQLNEFSRARLIKEHVDQTFPNTFGLLAVEVVLDSWAYKQGLRTFDSIIAVNGIPVNGLDDLTDEVKDLSVGDVINLIIIRDSVFMELTYELKVLEFDYMKFYDDRVAKQKRGSGNDGIR